MHLRRDVETDDVSVGAGRVREGGEAFAGTGADLEDAFAGLDCQERFAGGSGVAFEAAFDAFVAAAAAVVGSARVGLGTPDRRDPGHDPALSRSALSKRTGDLFGCASSQRTVRILISSLMNSHASA